MRQSAPEQFTLEQRPLADIPGTITANELAEVSGWIMLFLVAVAVTSGAIVYHFWKINKRNRED